MKTLLSLAAMTLLLSAVAFGQNNAGTAAQALATFEVGDQALALEGIDASWGILSNGVTYTITAEGLITPVTPEGAFEVEPLYWIISGGANVGAAVQVTFTLPPFFQGEGGTGFARIPYTVTSTSAGWFNEDPGPEVPYNAFDPRVPYTVYLNDSGEAFVGLGGVVTVPNNVPSEVVYEGVFIMTAAYTGF